MMLRRGDLEAVVKFLGDAVALDCDQPYTSRLLEGIRELIPCDGITYQEYDHAARRSFRLIGFDDDEGDFDWDADEEPDSIDAGVYWRLGPCPIVEHRVADGDLGAIRVSDIVSSRQFRRTPLYTEYFRPQAIEHMLDLGLAPRGSRQRSLILFRARAAPDFSERDRIVLEMLRPHLACRERTSLLRQSLREVQVPEVNGSRYPALTAREREVVELVGSGMTNAEVAAKLWISPSTVKKHLENVYAKVGIGRRAVAATLLRAPR